MKAILVLNMPRCCYDCEFCRFNDKYINDYYGRDCLITGEHVQKNNFDILASRHKTCPLRPLPQKVEMNMNEYYEGVADGWNDCIDEILGGKE